MVSLISCCGKRLNAYSWTYEGGSVEYAVEIFYPESHYLSSLSYEEAAICIQKWRNTRTRLDMYFTIYIVYVFEIIYVYKCLHLSASLLSHAFCISRSDSTV